MIRGVKLMKLVEQHVNEGYGVEGYSRTFRQLLGITESEERGMRLDTKAREISPYDFSFAEVARTFLGEKWRGRLNEAHARAMHVVEHEGHVVLPSSFGNISAYNMTVAGLLDAIMVEQYDSPEWIGDKIFPDKETRLNGGSAIGVMNDGQYGDSLEPGEAYPTVGLKETKVTIPENQRRGNTIQLVLQDFLYDRTDTIRDKAEKASVAVRRGKEIKQADMFLGVTTGTVIRDGKTANTYADAAGDLPNNYINTSVNTLTGYTDIDEARIILNQNRDPGTGFEITIPEPYDVAVMPQQWLELMAITRSTQVEYRTVDQTQIRRFESPLFPINPIALNMLWYNRMLLALSNASYAGNRWFMGKFDRAFEYRTLIPFQSNEAPLSSEDVRRDITLIRVAMEHGAPRVKEPRYVYMGTEEDISP